MIKLAKDSLKLSIRFLEAPEVWLWVGYSYGPPDNDDKRVIETRDLMKRHYSYVPYGMWVGNKGKNGEIKPIRDEDNDGFYDIDLSWWPVGVYRFNLHTGEKDGLRENNRDKGVVWSQIHDEKWNREDSESMKPFIHKEENETGFCFRILIRPNRAIEPMGDNI